jgi:hypothetical protein
LNICWFAGRKLGLARSATAVYGKSRASKRVFIDESRDLQDAGPGWATRGISIFGASELNALNCAGFKNMTEQPEQA